MKSETARIKALERLLNFYMSLWLSDRFTILHWPKLSAVMLLIAIACFMSAASLQIKERRTRRESL